MKMQMVTHEPKIWMNLWHYWDYFIWDNILFYFSATKSADLRKKHFTTIKCCISAFLSFRIHLNCINQSQSSQRVKLPNYSQGLELIVFQVGRSRTENKFNTLRYYMGPYDMVSKRLSFEGFIIDNKIPTQEVVASQDPWTTNSSKIVLFDLVLVFRFSGWNNIVFIWNKTH